MTQTEQRDKDGTINARSGIGTAMERHVIRDLHSELCIRELAQIATGRV